MKKISFTRLLAQTSVLTIASTMAAEETLKFRLIVMTVNETSADAPNIEGHSVSAGTFTGIAVLKDGRITHKEFVDITDNRGAEGSFPGYSTYTFENGDSLSLRYTGGWGAEGPVEIMKCSPVRVLMKAPRGRVTSMA